MTDEQPTTEPSARDECLRWHKELQAAHDDVKKWHERGMVVVRRYKNETEEGEPATDHRLNLFTVNVQAQDALLYGNVPKVSVDRRFADAADDVARVAGTMLERLLNADIERTGDTYAQALGSALEDRLLPGLGQVRVRYVAQTEKVAATQAVVSPDGTVLVEAVPEYERKVYECVHTDYVHWRDYRWSPARSHEEVRWVAFANDMSRDAFSARFGKDKAAAVTFTTPTPKDKQEEGKPDLWERCRVWEIWDKPSKRVHWFAEGAAALIESRDDPYGLTRFFPCPAPFLATTTNDKLLPVPDYELAENLYKQVDCLTQRIDMLTEAIRVTGAYDGSQPQLERMVKEKGNKLYPVDNWAHLGEKGGLKGVIDWFPLEQIVSTIQVLEEQRQIAKANLYEVTGLSDIMRGQAAETGVTATEQALKAKYASVRLQKLQDEFARFASDVQSLKAELIAGKYDPKTILTQSNMEHTADAQRAPEAVRLLKAKFAYYRIQVKPEVVSMQDFAALRAERTELLGAVTQFLQAVAPMAQTMPGSMPFLLRLLQWFVSGLRGSKEIEGVLDDAIQAAQQAAQQPQQQQPDPKLQATMAKIQGDIAKADKEHQNRLQEIQAETMAAERQEEVQAKFNTQEHLQKTLITEMLRPATKPAGTMPNGRKK